MRGLFRKSLDIFIAQSNQIILLFFLFSISPSGSHGLFSSITILFLLFLITLFTGAHKYLYLKNKKYTPILDCLYTCIYLFCILLFYSTYLLLFPDENAITSFHSSEFAFALDFKTSVIPLIFLIITMLMVFTQKDQFNGEGTVSNKKLLLYSIIPVVVGLFVYRNTSLIISSPMDLTFWKLQIGPYIFYQLLIEYLCFLLPTTNFIVVLFNNVFSTKRNILLIILPIIWLIFTHLIIFGVLLRR